MMGGVVAGVDRAYAQSAQGAFTFSMDPAFFRLAPAAASAGDQSATMGEGRNVTVTVASAQAQDPSLNPLLVPGIVAVALAVVLGFAAVHALRKPPSGWLGDM